MGLVGPSLSGSSESGVSVLAPRVSGNVKAVLTLPAAFAFGFGYFFARRLAGALLGRSKE